MHCRQVLLLEHISAVLGTQPPTVIIQATSGEFIFPFERKDMCWVLEVPNSNCGYSDPFSCANPLYLVGFGKMTEVNRFTGIVNAFGTVGPTPSEGLKGSRFIEAAITATTGIADNLDIPNHNIGKIMITCTKSSDVSCIGSKLSSNGLLLFMGIGGEVVGYFTHVATSSAPVAGATKCFP